ncbi:MAG TPA: hypothetical protein VLV78_21105 [Thermoanaerobaculia bacterium]|nr:hypothetical protein [Thermoanaerobaculia bacterium]
MKSSIGQYLAAVWAQMVDATTGATNLNFTTYSGSVWNDPAMMINSSGNVGIGGSPTEKLHVFGRVRVDGGAGVSRSALTTFIGTDAASASKTWFAGVNAFSTTDGSFEIKNTGGGGIQLEPGGRFALNGPALPTSIATMSFFDGTAGGITSSGLMGLILQNTNGGANTKAGVGFTLKGSIGQYLAAVWAQMVNPTTGATNLNFSTFSGSVWNDPAMTIDGLGNVGIGVIVPGARLDVNGTIYAAGDINSGGRINAKFQDVAEWVPATEDFAAGTVVVLERGARNRVTESRRAYDTAVAGVISAQPGIVLGEHGPGTMLVAASGRVRVHVDASRGPIDVGDLLVTSDKPGMAMRSEPVHLGDVAIHRPGTILGKALEPLAEGDGEILVLLSLQ